ncbi:MAG: hypothetical protein LUG16_03800 [Candidatus Gastranaerophilales bacterium]|nr:hypothetical protein [Candidatus Gastranaerophilales bacterium]
MQKQNIGLDKNLLHPARIMFLDYEFNYNGRVYFARGIDIGETYNIKQAKENIRENKITAICSAFNLTIDDITGMSSQASSRSREKINEILKNATFRYCELYN